MNFYLYLLSILLILGGYAFIGFLIFEGGWIFMIFIPILIEAQIELEKKQRGDD